MSIATWNVLHDGCVTAVEGAVPGVLRLSLEIAYLCRHLPTRAGHLVLVLNDCERFEYQPYEGDMVAAPAGVAALELGLLSAVEAGGSLRVYCSDGWAGGELVLRYASAQVVTVEGLTLSQAELESAAELYWSLWKEGE